MRPPIAALASGLGSFFWIASSVQAGLTIDHRPIDCVVAGKFPMLEARFGPAAEVARARVYFHGGDAGDWYFVEMKPQSGAFRGVLPKPKRDLARIRYYVEAIDKDLTPVRTEEFAPQVVPSSGVCAGKAVAAVAGTASVVVGAAGGAPVLPVGFAGSGVTVAGASGVAASGGGGSLGTAAVVVGGAGALTAAAVAVAKRGNDSSTCQSRNAGSLIVLERSATTLTLQWSVPQPPPGGCYTVDYLLGLPSCSAPLPPHNNVFEVQGTTATVTGLMPSTAYQIHVHGLSGCPGMAPSGMSTAGNTNTIFVRTLAPGAGPQPVGPSDYERCGCG